jgi:hypothetical protein
VSVGDGLVTVAVRCVTLMSFAWHLQQVQDLVDHWNSWVVENVELVT